jgi:hypothetical protein
MSYLKIYLISTENGKCVDTARVTVRNGAPDGIAGIALAAMDSDAMA